MAWTGLSRLPPESRAGYSARTRVPRRRRHHDTVAVDPRFRNISVPAGIVVIRTFRSFSLEVEIDGRWPWNRTLAEDGPHRKELKQVHLARRGERHSGRRLDPDVMALDDVVGRHEPIEERIAFVGVRWTDTAVARPGEADVGRVGAPSRTKAGAKPSCRRSLPGCPAHAAPRCPRASADPVWYVSIASSSSRRPSVPSARSARGSSAGTGRCSAGATGSSGAWGRRSSSARHGRRT